MNDLRNLPKQQRQKLLVKYLTIVFGFVGSFVLISSITILAFFVDTYTAPGGGVNNVTSNFLEGVSTNPSGGLLDVFTGESTPILTSFIVYGVDDEAGGADTVIIGTFNRITGAIQVINIPRDTFVVETPRTTEALSSIGRRFPNHSPKVADVFRLGNMNGHGHLILGTLIEDWLDIRFDYYAIVDLAAFRRIVDMVGPIEMYIPNHILYNTGHNNVIFDVPAGWNQLTGQTAEWVVRYRDGRGDIGRIATQQEFMQIFLSHILQLDVILNIDNMIEMLTILLNYVETDFTLVSAFAYARHITNISSFNAEIMPGDPSMFIQIGAHNISFVRPYEVELAQLVNRVFRGIYIEEETEEPITVVLGNTD